MDNYRTKSLRYADRLKKPLNNEKAMEFDKHLGDFSTQQMHFVSMIQYFLAESLVWHTRQSSEGFGCTDGGRNTYRSGDNVRVN